MARLATAKSYRDFRTTRRPGPSLMIALIAASPGRGARLGSRSKHASRKRLDGVGVRLGSSWPFFFLLFPEVVIHMPVSALQIAASRRT